MSNQHKILVVDDEQNMCMILRRILEKAGYKVQVASNGKKATEIAGRFKPDVAVLDLMMPGMSGREVCHVVRRISPGTRIIYFSAKVESEQNKLKELRDESDTFIAKPATSKKILSCVSAVLSS